MKEGNIIKFKNEKTKIKTKRACNSEWTLQCNEYIDDQKRFNIENKHFHKGR